MTRCAPRHCAIGLLLWSAALSAQGRRELALPDLDTSLEIKAPVALAWSPDGRRLAYQAAGPAGSVIRVHSLDTDSSVVLVSGIPGYRSYYERPDLRWTPDGRRVVYASGRDYFAVPASGGQRSPLSSSDRTVEVVQLSPDQQSISFIQDGDLWVRPVVGGDARRLTSGERLLAQPQQFFTRLWQWPVWSPDSRHIAFASSLEQNVRTGIIDVGTGATKWIVPADTGWMISMVAWSPGGDQLAISRFSLDYRRKELLVVDTSGERERRIRLDTDSAWVTQNNDAGFDVAWSSDGARLSFLSNREGWKHLYVAELGTGAVRQLTSGSYEVYSASWSPDNRHLLAVSSRAHRQHRLPWIIPVDGGGDGRPVRQGPGIAWVRDGWADAIWSPAGDQIVYSFSGPREAPGLWLARVGDSVRSVRIYSGLPAGFREEFVARMEPVQFPSADGMMIAGVVITAGNLDRRRRHPALVHMYGGWNQLAALGWGLSEKSILFNHLALRGYVILVVDPRGSEGYGRAYAKALYREGGGKQVDDLVAGARHLGKLGFVDTTAVAVFGHSYGGYLAVQTLVRAPETFAAGIALAGVFNYEGRSSAYTRVRFGPSDTVPNLLRERSPIFRIDRLRAPLLLMHGSGDFNVPISTSEGLIAALLSARKEFEYRLYPGEPHFLVGTDAIRDYFQSVTRFLDRHLKATRARP